MPLMYSGQLIRSHMLRINKFTQMKSVILCILIYTLNCFRFVNHVYLPCFSTVPCNISFMKQLFIRTHPIPNFFMFSDVIISGLLWRPTFPFRYSTPSPLPASRMPTKVWQGCGCAHIERTGPVHP